MTNVRLSGWLCVVMVAFGVGVARGQAGAMAVREDLREMIAGARDAVFPALVHIEVHTVSYWMGQESKGIATGSGTIIDPSGLVLTNAHVTRDGRRYFCTLADKQQVPAKLVGEDPWTDLALLQIDLSAVSGYEAGLPAAGFGDSEALETGDLVMAMGSPFALDRTVTLGIVSNTERVFTGGADKEVEHLMLDWNGQRTGLFTTWIQHDALINPGNSGGPLVNMKGEIVGINTRGGGGNGFATPSVIASAVAESLREHGSVPRSWIGVGFKHLERTGFDRGVFVDSVDSDGPAFEAGVRAGDVILEAGGEALMVRFPEQIPELERRIAEMPIGGMLDVRVVRGGEELEFSITTQALQLDDQGRVSLRGLGLTVADITPFTARLMRLDSTKGALVQGTRSGMPAALAQPPLEWGDVIHRAGGEAIDSIGDLVDLYNGLRESESMPEYLVIEFSRGDNELVTALRTDMPDPSDPPADLPKAWIGVETQPIVPELARQLGLADQLGFRITRIYPRTTAADSGLETGDVITSINGTSVRPTAMEQSGLFGREVRLLSIGSKARLEVLRNGEVREVEVALERSRTTPAEAKRGRNRDFGLTVRAITFFDRVDNRWEDDVKGVIVESVEDGSWAAGGGLSRGDLIQQIGDGEILSTKGFEEALEEVGERQPERVVFRVLRGYRTSFKFVEPEWKPQVEGD